MDKFELSAIGLAKSFVAGEYIFKNISINITNGSIFGITGDNGSGKSTLMKVLCGSTHPTDGSMGFKANGNSIDFDNFHRYFGYVAPYLNIYEEFTPLEHLTILAKIRGIGYDGNQAKTLLNRFNLFNRRHDEIKTFSSGMKQRMKFIIALQHSPAVLFLDEPSTNLDAAGVECFREVTEEYSKAGKAVIIATNDAREKALCKRTVDLSDYK